ncbi:MAG: carboxypeptidase regulatory-like domain-containing protein [Bacteroidales bacterium]
MKNVTKMLSRSMMLLTISILLFAKAGWAIDSYVQIGTGVVATGHPFYAFYADNRDQLIYLASEMSPTLMAGPLTKLGFQFTGTTGFTMPNFNIRMKQTSMSVVGGGFDEGGWTTVYSSAAFAFLGNGWQTITLTTPFVWNGTSNIEIEICHDSPDYIYGTNHTVNGTTLAAGVYRIIYAYTDTGTGCSLTPAQYISLTRANIRIYQPGGTLSGTVKNPAGVPISGATVAGGGGTATTIANGTYSMAVYGGTNNFTASAPPNYQNQTLAATVTPNGTATLNFTLTPVPCHLVGQITNAANGAPVTGAKIVVNGLTTYSIIGGLFALDIFPGGTFPVAISKAGFGDSTTVGYVFTPALTTTVNVAIKETTNKPSTPFVAALNGTPATQVALSWGVPKGYYELIYDDGIQTSSTVWEVEGNMNAVAFTPLNYPATIVGGSVNIGAEGDYPAGTLVADLDPFQIQIFDGTGPGGTPGAAVGDPVEVQATSFGWNTFVLPSTVCPTGKFFLAMVQGGAPPTAARLAVDADNSQLRSYSKFVTGGGSWLPADGNFMIRALVYGIGGPVDLPASVTGYQVFRLLQTQEATPALWTSVSTPTGTSTVDNSWPTLPDGAYRWAVKAQYTGNRWSGYTFSNVLGKNWTAAVTVNVGLTCTATPLAGSLVVLTNTTAGVDSVYTGTTGLTGSVTFPKVWKGPYHMVVSRMGYDLYSANVTINADQTFNVTLMQQTLAPMNMSVDNVSLLATWSPPTPITFQFADDFASGSFATNGWTAIAPWYVNAAAGNPSPSAEVPWTAMLVNYDNINLTSRNIIGIGAPDFKLKYDIYLNDFAGDGNEQMEVEIQAGGGAWVGLKHYANTGSIAWTTETINISAYASTTFKIRFRCHGADMFNFNYWNVDNVKVVSTLPDPGACILAYNVYLNGILDGVTMDTTYTIPSSHVSYGTSYDACVKAVYGSGYSDPSCDNFTAKFLCPPTQLTGIDLESTAYLTWKKPSCSGSGPAPQWIRWDDGTNVDAIGTGGAFLFDIAARWDVSQIAGLAGGSVTKIAFFPASSGTATYKVRVWQGANAANLIVDQAVPSPVIGQWNEITLNTPAAIDVTKELWIGANVNATAGYPAGVDGGPAIVGYGDMIADASTPWGSMMTLYGLNYNWNLAAYIETVKSPNQVVILKQDKIVSTVKGQFAVSGVKNTSDGATQANATKAPLAGPVLLGYNIKRDGAVIDFVGSPSTLEYYDYNLDPGTYTYEVTGYYDVTPFTPSHDNSQPAGPVDVTIDYGRPLPFYEPWDMGTFSFNDWTPTGDWVVTAGFGNPAPSADFSGLTLDLTNYANSMESPTLSAAPYTCAKIWCDFDLKLINRNNTGTEYLTVEVFKNGTWSKAGEFANTASIDWTSQHVELKSLLGKAFKVRFKANGASSQNILHWYVDNINVYAVCTPPTALVNTDVKDNDVYLSWTAPNCNQGPEPTWITWDDGTNLDAIGLTAGGTFNVAAKWDASMLTAFEGGAVTKIKFWPNDDATYILRVWNDDAGATVIYEQPVTPTIGDWNEITLTTPPSIDISKALWVGYNVTHGAGSYPAGCDPGPNVAGYGMLADLGAGWEDLNAYFDYNWDIEVLIGSGKSHQKSVALVQKPIVNENHQIAASGKLNTNSTVSSHTPSAPLASSLQGYNVYRSDDNKVTYNKVNTAVVPGTTYTDMNVTYAKHYYYVTSVFTECNSDSSNVVLADVIVGIDPISNVGGISIYPNPASDIVNVKSDNNITRIDVMNFVGQTVYANSDVTAKTSKINVSSFTAGVYFVKVTTSEGVRTVKITVTH